LFSTDIFFDCNLQERLQFWLIFIICLTNFLEHLQEVRRQLHKPKILENS
jgi:hypothetical protein